jgi:hypothetical protein
MHNVYIPTMGPSPKQVRTRIYSLQFRQDGFRKKAYEYITNFLKCGIK